MLSIIRHQKIVDELILHGAVKVSNLSRLFQVTEKTIREDLDALEQKALLKRVHGGAIAFPNGEIKSIAPEIPNTSFTVEKERIAEYTIEHFIQPGDIIALDTGSTTLEIAKRIKMYPLTVVTNDIMIIHELALAKEINLVVPGGYSYHNLLIQHEPIEWIRHVNIHKFFLSTTGIHLEYGLTVFAGEQIWLKQTMIHAAKHVICVADHSKFERGNLHTFAKVSDIEYFITDEGLDQSIKDAYLRSNIHIQLAK